MKTFVISTAVCLLFAGCSSKNQVNPDLANPIPQKMLWAWERPEDLRFIDTKHFGVAFLAQTIFLDKDGVSPKPRRQPLQLAPGTYLIAVTRIETKKGSAEKPDFSSEMVHKVVSLVRQTLELPDVKGIQVDFDAVVSERSFYRWMMTELRKRTPEGVTLTMTALASWCTGDAWFNDFPVDEAVPMAFQMGADEEKIKTYLRNGNDWREPLCHGSYGLLVDHPPLQNLKPGRRTYYFSNSPWRPTDIQRASQP